MVPQSGKTRKKLKSQNRRKVMGLVTDIEKFEQIKKKVEESQKKSGGWATDDRQIVWEAGKTYKFRLLFYNNDNTDFDGPFVEKWTHGARNADGKWKIITCPTTQYAKSGFDKCPVCTINNKLYNSKVDSDYELYKQFRRKFNGYAVVYVVQDQQNPDNEGHVKIIRFGVDIHRVLKERIYGVQQGDQELDEELYVGFDAFKLEDGKNLIVRVGKQGEWLKYDVQFSGTPTSIEVDEQQMNAEIEALKFGEDIREESEEKLQEFYEACVLQHVGDEDTGEVTDVMETAKETTEVSEDNTSVDDDVQALLNEDAVEEDKTEAQPETKSDDSNVDSVNTDIDNLLSDIAAEVGK
jgi:hypothetical protein